MSIRIEMVWSSARWDPGVEAELIKIMLDELSDAGRVLPDSVSVTRLEEETENV